MLYYAWQLAKEELVVKTRITGQYSWTELGKKGVLWKILFLGDWVVSTVEKTAVLC